MSEKGINVYICDKCTGKIVTDNSRGLVTPMYLRCRATPDCKGLMTSQWYRVAQDQTPTHEWYQPKLAGLSPEMADHVSRGGGVLRALAAPPADAGAQSVDSERREA